MSDTASNTDTGAPSRRLILIAAGLAAALAIGVALAGLLSQSDSPTPSRRPLPLVPILAPEADAPGCTSLVPNLPLELTSAGSTLPRRELAAPPPPATVAWGAPDPIVLRCGLERPPELTPTAALRVINGVQWLQVPGDGSATWYVVDREVYAGLTVPENAGTGPLQQVSNTVAATLEPAPVRFD